MATLTLRLPGDLEDRLSEEARLENKSRSDIAREALATYLLDADKKRFFNVLVEEAKQLGSRETSAIAEAFLPLDNEALSIAEGGRAISKARKGRKTR